MKKALALLLVFVLAATMLTGCGGSSSGGKDDGVIRVWVGEESADFYQKVCDEYVAAHSDFGYKIEVKGMDTGSVAGTITNDPTAAADIYTVAHDNIGKLAATQCAKPITDEALIILHPSRKSFTPRWTAISICMVFPISPRHCSCTTTKRS